MYLVRPVEFSFSATVSPFHRLTRKTFPQSWKPGWPPLVFPGACSTPAFGAIPLPGGLRRLDSLIATHRPDILILALGANDGLRGVDVKDISRNLSEIIIRAKREKSLVLLCGMQMPPLNMLPYGRRYREAFEEVAAQTDVVFVPFLLEGVAMNGQ